MFVGGLKNKLIRLTGLGLCNFNYLYKKIPLNTILIGLLQVLKSKCANKFCSKPLKTAIFSSNRFYITCISQFLSIYL